MDSLRNFHGSTQLWWRNQGRKTVLTCRKSKSLTEKSDPRSSSSVYLRWTRISTGPLTYSRCFRITRAQYTRSSKIIDDSKTSTFDDVFLTGRFTYHGLHRITVFLENLCPDYLYIRSFESFLRLFTSLDRIRNHFVNHFINGRYSTFCLSRRLFEHWNPFLYDSS